ncbi:hypothetical protein RIA_2114 [Riemerella anatipestifer RA-GD]|uniref:hypothetical protein n=1 Tax=Riemerella anatipestifer TaxID=34085 RepID=UPI000201107E|nr:hypothetical protein [Riemerella anatipestifer]ADZ13149.1 hypothetical protein RIA_2114 [Riemerella anatipestifer RA-GD]
MSETLYFNFPISFLSKTIQQGLKDPKATKEKRRLFLHHILYYHLYRYYLKLTEHYQETDMLEYEETDEQRMRKVAGYWNIKLGDIQSALINGKRLTDKKHCVFVGLNYDIFWDFYKNIDTKTQFDWDCLFMFLALKSIFRKK